MKTSELKIGDWVCVNGYNVQVGNAGCYLYNDKNQEVDYGPIPITTEILQKNGWTYTEVYPDFYVFVLENPDGYHHFELRHSNKATSWSFYKGTPSHGFNTKAIVLADIKYVHELQHILWALGINDNLKIINI